MSSALTAYRFTQLCHKTTGEIETHGWRRKKLLLNTADEVTVLWIPSHCDIPGNDKADAGSELNQDNTPVTHQIVKSKIKARKWSILHQKAMDTYGNRRKPDFWFVVAVAGCGVLWSSLPCFSFWFEVSLLLLLVRIAPFTLTGSLVPRCLRRAS